MVSVVTAGLWIARRQMTGTVEVVHDGQLQVEAALDFMRQGQIPYGQDYSNTPMGQRAFNERGLRVNPAVHHLAYLPLILEISYLPYRVGLAVWGWWDQRLLMIPLLLVTLLLMPQLARNPARKLALIPIVGLNPLLMLGFAEGRNDIVMILFVVLAALAFQRERRSLGMLAFGLACATKQLVWFGAPFLLVYLLGPWPWEKAAWARALRYAWPAALVFLATLAPFVVWEPRSFLADTFGYMLGIGDVLSIAKGYGLAGFLLDIGYLKHVTDPFPFSAFAVGIGLPVMLVLMLHQLEHLELRRVWHYMALLGLCVTFWSRFFLDNYIGFYVMVIMMATLMQREGDDAVALG
jgi:hypothetical protein